MNTDMLKQRLQDLRLQREQAIANVHALNGAIQLAELLLAELEEEPTKEN